MIADKRIVIGASIVGGVTALCLLKKYFAGTQCTISKDLSDDTAVITGGNTGIGKQTVRRLSSLGCRVIIGARDQAKSQQLVEELKDSKGKVTAFKLDLGDRASIQQFVKNVNIQLGNRPLNYLINNAGVMAIPQRKTTKQGFQMQIGVNHFGHFYLTYLLWNSLKKAGNPRIINVSSRAHKNRGQGFDIDFQNLHYEKGGYKAFQAYSHSKKANILFTKQLQRRMNLAKMNGISICLHPGVVRTQLSRDMINTGWKKALFSLLTPIAYLTFKSSEQGAQTTIYGVLQRQDKLKGGQYYADCQPAQLLAKQCESQQAALKLWQVAEKSFGIKFNI